MNNTLIKNSKTHKQLELEFSLHIKSGLPIELNRILYSWSDSELIKLATFSSSHSLNYLKIDHYNFFEELPKLNILEVDLHIAGNRTTSKENIENLIKKYNFKYFTQEIIYQSQKPEILDFLYENYNSDDCDLKVLLSQKYKTSFTTLEKIINTNQEVDVNISFRRNLPKEIIAKLISKNINVEVFLNLKNEANLTFSQKLKIKKILRREEIKFKSSEKISHANDEVKYYIREQRLERIKNRFLRI